MLKYFKPVKRPLKPAVCARSSNGNVASSSSSPPSRPSAVPERPTSSVRAAAGTCSSSSSSSSSVKRKRWGSTCSSPSSDDERPRPPPAKKTRPTGAGWWSEEQQEQQEEEGGGRPGTAVTTTSPSPRPDWRHIRSENLSCDYAVLYGRRAATQLLQDCERELTYFESKELTRVEVFGKWYDIPRKQVAHGDRGLSYRYSGITVPALPWTPLLMGIRERVQEVTGVTFNFVLINRYKDGNDYIGEHRDDEKELVATSPIASLSLGQNRDFVFRHGESRGRNAKRNVPPVKLELEHGSLLVMNFPTNVFWYHSLPVRKKAIFPRINMTFRCLKT